MTSTDVECCLVENTSNDVLGTKNKHEKQNNSKVKVGCIISVLLCLTLLIIILLNLLNILSYSFNIIEKTGNQKVGQENYYFMLPVHQTNDTVTEGQTNRQYYTKIPASESLMFFFLLLSGYHFVLLQGKASENVDDNQYTVERLLQTTNFANKKESTQIKDPNSSNVYGNNVTTGITIQESGPYYVYSCMQITCIKKTNDKYVTHYVTVNTGSKNRTIIEKKVNIPHGRGTYETSNALIYVHLTQNDTVSMVVSDDTYLYHSRQSNVLGVLKM